jgi:hypothetical protein
MIVELLAWGRVRAHHVLLLQQGIICNVWNVIAWVIRPKLQLYFQHRLPYR